MTHPPDKPGWAGHLSAARAAVRRMADDATIGAARSAALLAAVEQIDAARREVTACFRKKRDAAGIR